MTLETPMDFNRFGRKFQARVGDWLEQVNRERALEKTEASERQRRIFTTEAAEKAEKRYFTLLAPLPLW